MSMTLEQIDAMNKRPWVCSDNDFHELVALAKRGLAADEAANGLMDCKGYDLFPDGTLRPAHGLGEWVRAQDYDKLHAANAAAQAEIAMLKNEYICKCGLRVTPHRCKTGEEF